MLKQLKNGIIHGIGILLVIGLAGISYATFVEITNVDSNTILTSKLMNDIIDNQKTIISGSRVNETANKNLGQPYTNNYEKPILVSVIISATSVTDAVYGQLIIDGDIVSKSYNGIDSSNTDTIFVSGLVPPGSTYQVDNSSLGNLLRWKEFK